MRTIEEIVREIKLIYPKYADPRKGYDSCVRLHDKLDEILEIYEAGKSRSGKWVLSGGKYRCSECREKTKYIYDKSTGGYNEYKPFRSDFCPNCGAYMEVKS